MTLFQEKQIKCSFTKHSEVLFSVTTLSDRIRESKVLFTEMQTMLACTVKTVIIIIIIVIIIIIIVIVIVIIIIIIVAVAVVLSSNNNNNDNHMLSLQNMQTATAAAL